MTTPEEKERNAYEAGRYIYIGIRLNRTPSSVKDTVLSTIPDVMSHYDKEEGFEGEEDSKAFFRWLEAFYQLKPSTFVRRAKKMNLPHVQEFAEILKQSPQ